LCRSYVDHSALRRRVELGVGPSNMRFDASRAQLHPPTPRKISLPAQQTERSSRQSHPSRQVEISRARLSRSGRGCAAIHQGRVRVPLCASSATLGNILATERVNGRLALERRFGYSPSRRFHSPLPLGRRSPPVKTPRLLFPETGNKLYLNKKHKTANKAVNCKQSQSSEAGEDADGMKLNLKLGVG